MQKSGLLSVLVHSPSATVGLIWYVQSSVCVSSPYGDRLFAQTSSFFWAQDSLLSYRNVDILIEM